MHFLDFYDVLQVAETATSKELKKAYRQQSLRWHPDRNHGSSESEERFRLVQTAYHELSDPVRREAFNRRLTFEKSRGYCRNGPSPTPAAAPPQAGSSAASRPKTARPKKTSASAASRPKTARPKKTSASAASRPKAKARPRSKASAPPNQPQASSKPADRKPTFTSVAFQATRHLPAEKRIGWTIAGFLADVLFGVARSR